MSFLTSFKKIWDMKKLLFLVIPLIIIVGYIVVSCEKEPIKYTIEASAGLGGMISPSGIFEVVAGSSKVFTPIPDPGFKVDFITVNGVDSPLTSPYFSLLNIGKDYIINLTFKKTLSWYAMQGAWNLDSVLVKQPDETWLPMIMDRRDSLILFPIGTYLYYRDGVKIGDGRWSVSETTIPATFTRGGFPWDIERLDEGFLILMSKDGYIRHIYSHH